MADISKITIPVGGSTQTFNIKDEIARAAIAGGTAFAGITTTVLYDGATTASISVDGDSVTAVNGMMAIYNHKEFVYASSDGKWHEFGDLSTLGALASKDSASGSYTPAGTVSQPTASATTSSTTVNSITAVGTLPTFTVSNETLTITAGTLPTKGSDTTVITAVSGVTVSQPTFSGTAAPITVE